MSTQDRPPKGRGPKLSSEQAQARLADALRANLKRRKAQVRARDDAVAGPDNNEEPSALDKTLADKTR